MTSVPRTAPKRNDTRKYSAWEWTRGYLVLLATLPFFPLMWLLDKLRLPNWLTQKLLRWHIASTSRPMDFRIPPDPSIPVYMERWWYVPRNWAVNCYLHIFRRSDDDRALHDHPWWSFSVVLDGGYWEHTIADGGVNTKTWCGPGSMRFRWTGRKAHRVELPPLENINGTWRKADTISGLAERPARTIFITGPVLRRWGFHATWTWVDAYQWDAFCELAGIENKTPMDGGSDAAVSERNHLKRN